MIFGVDVQLITSVELKYFVYPETVNEEILLREIISKTIVNHINAEF